jgi:nitrous oxidase accessory protein
MSRVNLRNPQYGFNTLRLIALLILLPGLCLGESASPKYPSFQALVDAAEANDVISPPAGTYAGPVVLDQPLTLDGRGEVTIDNGGSGTVIYLDTDGATIKGLRLTNSGESHNDLDSGVQVRGNFNVIKDNTIDDCLFGVDLQQSEYNIVRRNHISSKDAPLGLRGDAIRLWYSFNNQVTDNVIRNSRDTVVWYSKDNVISRNNAQNGRYSLHFMYSQHNIVEDNYYKNNSVGIFLMYSDDVEVRRNFIAHATGATGMAIGFKETSGVIIEGNKFLYNAVGLSLDVSPYQPDTVNKISDNLIAYNGIGIQFLNDWHGNIFKGNRIQGNLTQVAVLGGKGATHNEWDGNYWDDYEGFDRNGDGIGDTPYKIFRYADRFWMDVPAARFFKGSPMLEVIDLLERLAPFTQPSLILEDRKPAMSADAAPTSAAETTPEETVQ